MSWAASRSRLIEQHFLDNGIGLRRRDAHLGVSAHLRWRGKVPQEPRHHTHHGNRCHAAQLAGRTRDTDPILCTRSERPLIRDAIEQMVAKHAAAAARSNSALTLTKHISPDTLRHTAAVGSAARRCRPVGDRALARPQQKC